MKVIFRILNIVYGLYFFLYFNFIFWLSLLGLVFSKQSSNNFILYSNLIFGLLFLLTSVLFFKRSNKRYIIGLILLFIDWMFGQVVRFLFITNMKLEQADLNNLVFFGIPFLILLVSMFFDKKYEKDVKEIISPTIPMDQTNPQPQVQNFPAQTSQPIAATINKPARITFRISAIIIDSAIILGIWSIISLPLAILFNIHILIKDANSSPLFTVYFLVGAIIQVVYFSIFHARSGATPGKKLFGLKVIDLNSNLNLSYSKAFLREIIKSGIGIIPIIGGLLNLINAIVVVFSKTKQGLHDKVVKSQVIEVGIPASLLKQVLFYILLLSFWAISTLILVGFVFRIGNAQ